jgi:hypothetical protein
VRQEGAPTDDNVLVLGAAQVLLECCSVLCPTTNVKSDASHVLQSVSASVGMVSRLVKVVSPKKKKSNYHPVS